MKLFTTALPAALLIATCLVPPVFAAPAEPYKEGELIRILQSDSPLAEKAITCKRLAVYGSPAAVPALAPLLESRDLSSWARIALEAIPGPAADKALRDALDKTQGRILVGVINSIGVRKDPKAVKPLIAKLNGSDPDVAAAAAAALGRVGGSDASKALLAALKKAPASQRGAVAFGCVLAGENYLRQKNNGAAEKLYDAVRKADVPMQRKLEGIRGAILARGSSGIPLLLEQLRSEDKDTLAIGLRTARELPGRDVTKALASELGKSTPDRQARLLLALADRADSTAVPAIVDAARTGSTPVRMAAVGVLEKLGNVSSVPVLLDLSMNPDAGVSQAAKNALTRLPGSDIDADLQQRLGSANGKLRQNLIELAGRRQIPSALPMIVTSVKDSDAGVRTAAIQALGSMGTEKDIPTLVNLLKANSQKDAGEIEAALLAICGRVGATAVPALMPIASQGPTETRIVALHALASAGGPQALATLKAATEASEPEVQDEAVRTLSSWPNTWPDDVGVAEPLLTIARNGKKTSHQVLALRGYIQHLQTGKDISDAQKVKSLDEILPILRRPEEKRLAIPILQNINSADSLEVLTNFAGDSGVADDACAAIVKISGSKNNPVAKDARAKALQVAVDKCGNDNTKRRAERLLADLK